MTHYLISKEDASTIRAALSGDALHTFESGLHVTEFAPMDLAHPTVHEFADAYLTPVMQAAHAHGFGVYALAVEVIDDGDGEPLYAGDRAHAGQLGEGAAWRSLLKDALTLAADRL